MTALPLPTIVNHRPHVCCYDGLYWTIISGYRVQPPRCVELRTADPRVIIHFRSCHGPALGQGRCTYYVTRPGNSPSGSSQFIRCFFVSTSHFSFVATEKTRSIRPIDAKLWNISITKMSLFQTPLYQIFKSVICFTWFIYFFFNIN